MAKREPGEASSSRTTPRLQREDTFVIEDLRRRNRKRHYVNSSRAESDQQLPCSPPGRRQWRSVDYGSPDRAPDASWGKENLSDVHFDRLREELAQECEPEGQLKVAADLLSDPEGLDPDEISYRREQAAFWTLKAAERGSQEAREKLQAMVRRGSQVQAMDSTTRTAVQNILNMTNTEFRALKVGQLKYKELTQDGMQASISMQELRKTDQTTGNESSETTSKDEYVTKAELLKAADDVFHGQIPALDARLLDCETSPKSKVMAFIRRAALWALVGLAIFFILNLKQSSSDIFYASLLAAFACYQVSQRHSRRRSRFSTWTAIFRPHFSANEEGTLFNEFERTEHLRQLSLNLLLVYFILSQCLGESDLLGKMALLNVLVAVVTSSAPFVALSVITFLLSLEFAPWLMIWDLIPDRLHVFPELESLKGGVLVLIFAILCCCRRDRSAALNVISLALAANQCARHVLIEKTTAKTQLLGLYFAAVAVMAVIALFSSGQRQKKKQRRQSRAILPLCVGLLALSSSLGSLLPSLPALEPLTWSAYRLKCPRERPEIGDQLTCLRLQGSLIEASGVATQISLQTEHGWLSTLLHGRLTEASRRLELLCEKAAAASYSETCRSLSSGFRQSILWPVEPSLKAEIALKVRTSFLSDEMIRVHISSRDWRSIQTLAEGSALKITGRLISDYNVPIIYTE